MEITLKSIVCASPETFKGAVDGELIIFDPSSGSYFGSGPVGARIWALIENDTLVEDICVTLLQEFEVDREVCEGDVLSFVSELSKSGLVQIK